MSKTIKPIRDRIAFNIIERTANETDEHGLMAPNREAYHEKLIVRGVVVAIGDDVTSIEVGDEIILNITTAIDIKPTGYDVKVISESDVIAVAR